RRAWSAVVGSPFPAAARAARSWVSPASAGAGSSQYPPEPPSPREATASSATTAHVAHFGAGGRTVPGSGRRMPDPPGRRPAPREGARAVPGIRLHRSERARVSAGEDPHELVVEVVGRLAHGSGHAVRVHLPAALDVLLEPLVDVLLPPSLVHLGLVVELDLAHHEAREALGVLVGFLLFGGKGGARRRGRRRRGPGGRR